jgi:hypothetical protein
MVVLEFLMGWHKNLGGVRESKGGKKWSWVSNHHESWITRRLIGSATRRPFKRHPERLYLVAKQPYTHCLNGVGIIHTHTPTCFLIIFKNMSIIYIKKSP